MEAALSTTGPSGADGPYSWPTNNGNVEAKDAVAFCRTHVWDDPNTEWDRSDSDSDGRIDCLDAADFGGAPKCRQGADFEQLNDGLIDSFSDDIRFAIGAFDPTDILPDSGPSRHRQCGPTLASPNTNYCSTTTPVGVPNLRNDLWGARDGLGGCLVPFSSCWNTAFPYGLQSNAGTCSTSLGAGCWGSFQCQNGTTGTFCTLPGTFTFDGNPFTSTTPQWSYWRASNGDSWLNGARGAYGSLNMVRDGLRHSYSNLDAGMRNSRARPTFGRLVGFGPPEYDPAAIPNPYQVDCNDEDTCTAEHNRMVQQVILGQEANLDFSTPLAAMLRDAYEFITFDEETKGVHLPHARNRDITAVPELFGEIGPQTDPYFTDGTSPCRSTAVILVTDGEPAADLNQRVSTYANRLRVEANVNTYVVGVGLANATWDPLGAVPPQTLACDTLTVDDLGVDRICQRTSATSMNFRFAATSMMPQITDPDPDVQAALRSEAAASIRACCTLLETAVEGGTNKAYFPTNATELKQRFTEIINGLAGSPVARTLPVFGGVTASSTTIPGNDAEAVSYEIRSSMSVTGDDSLWRGNLQRVRSRCDGSDPELIPVDPTLGDDFGANLVNSTPAFPRKFFTVTVEDGRNIQGSIRRPSANSDGLFEDEPEEGDWHYPNDVATLSWATSTGIVNVADLPDAINEAWPGDDDDDLDEIFDLGGGDDDDCDDQLGTDAIGGSAKRVECAKRATLWYAGHPDPDGAASTDAPSRDPNSAQCRGSCSPLGAIYRSTPVFVPPPSLADSDDQNFARDRGAISDSFVVDHGERPTMLYAQTIDGQLHAFVVARNQVASGPPYGDVTIGDEPQNNELWTFVPPAVLPRVWEDFNKHARLLDGQLAWANVVYSRGVNRDVDPLDPDFNTNVTLWSYDTVIVGCNGTADSGVPGFCYALEVTNPLEPKFLWQLSTSGDDDGRPDEPLFGAHVPGAAITHVRLGNEVIAVAVIPGGSPGGSVPGGDRDRAFEDPVWNGDAREPREEVRNWSGDQPGRSLTFVELRTGRIIARLVQDDDDDPELDDEVTVEVPFDSPLTGIPAPYPNGLGAIAQRIYVGDADGTLWRVELNPPTDIDEPLENWRARIAFDAYNAETLQNAWVGAGPGAGAVLGVTLSEDDAARAGQPIQTAPTLSLDTENNVVVSFATGNQEDFNTSTPGRINMLVSFVDRFDGTNYRPAFGGTPPTGVEMAWRDGGSVTGQLNIFDGQLFFAYFNPAPGTGCVVGTGGLCGVNYIGRESDRPVALGLFGVGATDYCEDFDDGEVVFGVSVNKVQSCAIDTETFGDPWLTGSYTAMTQANPGNYELVFQTGQNGLDPAGGGVTKRSTKALPRPASSTKIRSFVRIAEAE
jgi:type IV pilus assembly protein PilY1